MGAFVNPQTPNLNIQSTMDYMKNIADQAIQAANSAIINTFTTEFDSGQFGGLDTIEVNATFNKPEKPTDPNFQPPSMAFPSAPSSNYPVVDVSAIDTSGAPSSYIPVDLPPPPGLNIPTAPNAFTELAPTSPGVEPAPEAPDAPNTQLGDIPDLENIVIPRAPNVAIISFDQKFPENNLEVPNLDYQIQDYSYSQYLSLLGNGNLLADITTRIKSNLSGGSGFNSNVEQAIYDRGKDRELKDNVLAIEHINEVEAAQGWSRPNGSKLAAMQNAIQQTQQRNAELSREIMIKQAELEQSNMRFSISQAIQLETSLLGLHQQQARLVFEQARYVQDLLQEVYRLQVLDFQTKTSAYTAYATAFEARVRGQLSQVEVFKAQIEGEKAKADVNQSKISAYSAKANAILAEANAYRAVVDGINATVKREEVKIQAFKAEVEAYSEKVKAKTAEYSGYAELVRAEIAKAQLYDSEVKAYSAKASAKSEEYKNQVQAYSALIEARAKDADIKIKSLDSQTQVERLKIEDYRARIEAFSAKIEEEYKAYQNLINLYRGKAEIYASEVRGEEAKSNVDLKKIQESIEQNKNKADISVQNARVVMDKIQFTEAMRIKSSETEANIHAGIASSALSAINVGESAKIGSNVDLSESYKFNGRV